MIRLPALAALVLAAACGAADAGSSEPVWASAPASAPVAGKAAGKVAGKATGKAAAVVTTTTTHYRHAGLLWNKAVEALPVSARRGTPGYPGHGFRFGTIEDAATWNAFAAA